MIASDTLFDSRGWVFGVKLSDEDIADFEVLRDGDMATVFGFLYMGCTLAPPEEYDSTVHVRRRCGLMSNYFDHLLLVWPPNSADHIFCSCAFYLLLSFSSPILTLSGRRLDV